MISTFTNEGFMGLASKLGEKKDHFMKGVPHKEEIVEKFASTLGNQFAIDVSEDGKGGELHTPFEGMTAADIERHHKTILDTPPMEWLKLAVTAPFKMDTWKANLRKMAEDEYARKKAAGDPTIEEYHQIMEGNAEEL